MRARRISNLEIGLIKAMLQRKMRNTDIQFYFNRPVRALNAGRISDIAAGKYGSSASLPPASPDELDHFIASRHGVASGGSAAGTHLQENIGNEPNLLMLFSNDPDGVWRIRDNESDEHECKLGFSLRRASKWVRAVAALANNRGGYIFFGVHDRNDNIVSLRGKGVGLSTEGFSNANPADVATRLRSALDPTPRVSIFTLNVGNIDVGVMKVLIIPFTHPAMMTRYGCGAVRAQA